MKHFFYSLLLIAISAATSQGANGLIINGSQYNSGQSAYIPCGENQTVTINAWTNTTTSAVSILAGSLLPSGWTATYCGGNCLSLNTSASSGGWLKVEYLTTSGEQKWVQVFVSRTPLNHLINGPDLICGTTATYTFSGSFYTGSPSWSSSNPFVLSINSSTGVATVHGSGPVILTATVNTSCGPTPTQRTIHVGKPTVTALEASAFMCNGASQELTATISGSPTFRQWAVTSGNASNAYLTDYGNGRCYFNSYINDCYGLQIQMTNTCGSSLDGITICVDNCGARYAIYPNPTSEYINLKIQDFNPSTTLPTYIQLFGEDTQVAVKTLGRDQIRKVIDETGVLNIPIHGLTKGNYYLHVFSDGPEGKKLDKVRVAVN